MDDTITVQHEGQGWVWDGSRWYNATTFMSPSVALALKLNELALNAISAQDASIADPRELQRRAVIARNAKQYQRAVSLLRRCLQLDPRKTGAAAALCATLRELGRSKEALDVTQAFRNSNSVALITSRAAAMCDEELWEDALREIRRALAIEASGEAFAVHRRIKANAPNLFS